MSFKIVCEDANQAQTFTKPIDGFAAIIIFNLPDKENIIAMEVDGLLQDLSNVISKDSNIKYIRSNSKEALPIIRHDTAHVLAQAIKELYPDAKLGIGPAISDGFYYDIDYKDNFSHQDLSIIDQKMREIIERNEKFTRIVLSKSDAIKCFTEIGEIYKSELIEKFSDNEEITIYKQGDFFDLCKGPHGPSTHYLGAFKLTQISGSYWRGDSNRRLQRIYGTAWKNKEELQKHLDFLEEIEKRDHRRLGLKMDLFHFQEEAPGCAFWHPKGCKLLITAITYLRHKQESRGYKEIITPTIIDRSLWEKSGHWEKFKENMFIAQVHDENKVYAIKPMNCPGAVQIFNRLFGGVCSYRSLPLRLSEFGSVSRNEPSGGLYGLMRARGFTQDDAHIFCTKKQLIDEIKAICDLIVEVYKDFGFTDETIEIKYSDRPIQRVGSDENWDSAEEALLNAIEFLGLKYTKNPGEGAFYGPKLEFHLKDKMGRDWQLGTVQVDLNLPERLEAFYIGEDGKKHIPIMIHRAIFGSLERFLAILIEHYNGNLPLWLAPVQVVILTINDNMIDYGRKVLAAFEKSGVKAELDNQNLTLSKKIRYYVELKIPILAILGENEVNNEQVSLRMFGKDTQEKLRLEAAVELIKNQSKMP